MNIEVLLVQFLVLAFTGALWWLARRDLSSRPAPPMPAAPSADTRELEQLCATLAALVTDLAGRLEAVEQRSHGAVGAPLAAPPLAPAPTSAPVPSFPVSMPAEPESASQTALYALLDAGVTDPAEIARRTGLGRGEVDLILSLRARRAL